MATNLNFCQLFFLIRNIFQNTTKKLVTAKVYILIVIKHQLNECQEAIIASVKGKSVLCMQGLSSRYTVEPLSLEIYEKCVRYRFTILGMKRLELQVTESLKHDNRL